jgi:hypothetical protein
VPLTFRIFGISYFYLFSCQWDLTWHAPGLNGTPQNPGGFYLAEWTSQVFDGEGWKRDENSTIYKSIGFLSPLGYFIVGDLVRGH